MIRPKGQSLSEYSLMLAMVFIAVVAVHIYAKRGLQGRYKDVVNEVTTAAAAQQQYEPYYAVSESTVDAPRHITTAHELAGIKEGKLVRKLLTDTGPTTVETNTTETADVEGWKDIK